MNLPCDPCARKVKSTNEIDVLTDAMIEHGIPKHSRTDNGPEFVAEVPRKWLACTGSATLHIEPGSAKRKRAAPSVSPHK